MDFNIIRNYQLVSSTKYISKTIPIKTENDKAYCLQFITNKNKHIGLCHNYYNDDYIKTAIEEGDSLLFFHTQDNIENIIAFALVKQMQKKKGKILNILLVCAIPNKKKFGQMIAHLLHNFAIQRGCKFLYTSPRTDALRQTFIKYGFEPIFGVKGIDEVLEKEVENNQIIIEYSGKTRKVKSKNRSYN